MRQLTFREVSWSAVSTAADVLEEWSEEELGKPSNDSRPPAYWEGIDAAIARLREIEETLA